MENQTVAVTGFFFSGSSAICDFLLDHVNFVSFSDEDCEPRLLRGNYEHGLGEILMALRTHGIVQDRQTLINNCKTSIFGEDPRNFNQLMNMNLRRRLGSKFDEVFEDLLEELPALDGNDSAVEFHNKCRKAFETCFRIIPGWTPASTIVVNNDPPSLYGTLEAALEVYPNCRGIAVLRDPLDMFFEASKFYSVGFPPTANGARIWIKTIVSSLERFEPLASHPSVITTMFEKFVRDPAERDRIIGFVGSLDNAQVRAKFNPDKSAANIGLYKSLQDDILESIRENVAPIMVRVLRAAGRNDLAEDLQIRFDT